MKNLMKTLAFAGIALSAATAQAQPEIFSGSYLTTTDEIELQVAYGGGCEEHIFSLEVSPFCLESFPAQCSAVLADSGEDDVCEAYISETIRLPAPEITSRPYYLTVEGSNDSQVTVLVGELVSIEK